MTEKAAGHSGTDGILTPQTACGRPRGRGNRGRTGSGERDFRGAAEKGCGPVFRRRIRRLLEQIFGRGSGGNRESRPRRGGLRTERRVEGRRAMRLFKVAESRRGLPEGGGSDGRGLRRRAPPTGSDPRCGSARVWMHADFCGSGARESAAAAGRRRMTGSWERQAMGVALQDRVIKQVMQSEGGRGERAFSAQLEKGRGWSSVGG